jgi:hypothetical protein
MNISMFVYINIKGLQHGTFYTINNTGAEKQSGLRGYGEYLGLGHN